MYKKSGIMILESIVRVNRISYCFLFPFLLFIYSFQATGQTSKDEKEDYKARTGASDFSTYQKYNKRLGRSYDKEVKAFRKRMKQNVKKYKKMYRQLDKPQYSDPTYFGHKRPPKKRPLGKRKFCKVCGIVH